MAEFDMKTATAIVQTYDGSAETFVDAANLLKEFTKPDQAVTAIKFLRSRLTGKARQGLAEQINTIDALISDVQTRCAEKTTPQSILAKLKMVNQKGDVEKFCAEVESLSTQLQNVYLRLSKDTRRRRKINGH